MDNGGYGHQPSQGSHQPSPFAGPDMEPWTCGTCSFVNTIYERNCGVCSNPRGISYVPIMMDFAGYRFNSEEELGQAVLTAIAMSDNPSLDQAMPMNLEFVENHHQPPSSYSINLASPASVGGTENVPVLMIPSPPSTQEYHGVSVVQIDQNGMGLEVPHSGNVPVVSAPLNLPSVPKTPVTKNKKPDVVVINVNLTHPVSHNKKRWFCDFGRHGPDTHVLDTERVTKRFHNTILNLRQLVGSKEKKWDSIEQVNLEITKFLGNEPIQKTGNPRPRDKRIEINFHPTLKPGAEDLTDDSIPTVVVQNPVESVQLPLKTQENLVQNASSCIQRSLQVNEQSPVHPATVPIQVNSPSLPFPTNFPVIPVVVSRPRFPFNEFQTVPKPSDPNIVLDVRNQGPVHKTPSAQSHVYQCQIPGSVQSQGNSVPVPSVNQLQETSITAQSQRQVIDQTQIVDNDWEQTPGSTVTVTNDRRNECNRGIPFPLGTVFALPDFDDPPGSTFTVIQDGQFTPTTDWMRNSHLSFTKNQDGPNLVKIEEVSPSPKLRILDEAFTIPNTMSALPNSSTTVLKVPSYEPKRLSFPTSSLKENHSEETCRIENGSGFKIEKGFRVDVKSKKPRKTILKTTVRESSKVARKSDVAIKPAVKRSKKRNSIESNSTFIEKKPPSRSTMAKTVGTQWSPQKNVPISDKRESLVRVVYKPPKEICPLTSAPQIPFVDFDTPEISAVGKTLPLLLKSEKISPEDFKIAEASAVKKTPPSQIQLKDFKISESSAVEKTPPPQIPLKDFKIAEASVVKKAPPPEISLKFFKTSESSMVEKTPPPHSTFQDRDRSMPSFSPHITFVDFEKSPTIEAPKEYRIQKTTDEDLSTFPEKIVPKSPEKCTFSFGNENLTTNSVGKKKKLAKSLEKDVSEKSDNANEPVKASVVATKKVTSKSPVKAISELDEQTCSTRSPGKNKFAKDPEKDILLKSDTDIANESATANVDATKKVSSKSRTKSAGKKKKIAQSLEKDILHTSDNANESETGSVDATKKVTLKSPEKAISKLEDQTSTMSAGNKKFAKDSEKDILRKPDTDNETATASVDATKKITPKGSKKAISKLDGPTPSTRSTTKKKLAKGPETKRPEKAISKLGDPIPSTSSAGKTKRFAKDPEKGLLNKSETVNEPVTASVDATKVPLKTPEKALSMLDGPTASTRSATKKKFAKGPETKNPEQAIFKLDDQMPSTSFAAKAKDKATEGSGMMPSSSYKVGSARWHPSQEEINELYKPLSFLIEAVNENKPPGEVKLWRIAATDPNVVLNEYKPYDLNGRIFHIPDDRCRVYDKMDKPFFSRYHPVYTVTIHDTDEVNVHQYRQVDRIVPQLLRVRSLEDDLLLDFMGVMHLIYLHIALYPSAFIKSMVSANSPKCDADYKTAWENIDAEVNDRVKVIVTETRLAAGIVAPFRQFTRITMTGMTKSEDCTSCLPRRRKAGYHCVFKGGVHDPLSFRRLRKQPQPPTNMYFCWSCKPYIVLIDKLLNTKFWMYATVRTHVTDQLGELGPDELLNLDEAATSFLKDHEYIGQSFLEYLVVLAEADQYIETLKRESSRQVLIDE